jgi:hypothetical protein
MQIEPARASVVENVLPRRDILKELLFAGLTALDNDHLSEPRDGSAADYFGQVLDVDPENAIALDGMRRLVARYVLLAERAQQNGAYDVARGYLKKAEPYAIPDDGLEELRRRWQQNSVKVAGPSNEFTLDPVALDARGEAIMLRLTEIAVKAMRASSRITIVARTDAEGRWIYQQMREVLPEYRLRGNIVQGQVPKVILIDLAANKLK